MTWLSAVLEPLCDAEPNALAKYVLALIKKDKPATEVRQSMEDQMEVFLQENTAPFIDELFKTLENKDYLDGPPAEKLLVRKEGDSDAEEAAEGDDEGKPDSTTSKDQASEHKDEEIAKGGKRLSGEVSCTFLAIFIMQ